MGSHPGPTNRVIIFLRAAADAITYAIAVAAVFTPTSLVVGIATGGGFNRGKIFLFLSGWVIIGYGVVLLWPSTPADLEQGIAGDSIPERSDRTKFQALVSRLPPLRWMMPPPAEHRLSTGSKLLLSGLLALAISFAMEVVAGIE